MKRAYFGKSLCLLGISVLAGSHFIPQTCGAPPIASSAADPESTTFSAQAKALPFPPDAREVEFDATFKDIEFKSGSSLASLTAFYRAEMQKRAWEHDTSADEIDKDSVEMTFKHGDAEVVLSLDERSDKTVDVSMDCEGLGFAGADDPAGLVAAGVPQPRAYLFLQKEIPRPDPILDVEYQGDACHFKSPMALQAAFDYYLNAVKGLGWRESRRPIITGDRRYTEFKRGPVTLSVNIFSHEVGSRIILGYEDDRKEPVVPPLAAVASTTPTKQPGREPTGGARPVDTAKPIVDVSKNTGTASVTQGTNKHLFKYVAAYQTKDSRDKTTLLFSERPIPYQRMQSMLAGNDDFSFFDLYPGSAPGSLKIEVNGYVGYSFNAGGVGIGSGIDDPEGSVKIEEGRARGSIKMREPAKVFDETFYLSVTIDAAVMTPDTRLGSLPDQPVVARESPFPGSEALLPDGTSDVQSEGTRYRKVTHATVDLELQAVAKFYQTELAKQQWKENEAARVWKLEEPVPQAMLQFTGPAGKMTVSLQRKNDRTAIDVSSLNEAKARQDGVLPEPGKARLVMGNAHTRDVVIAIGKQDYPLKAGRGANDPKTALNYSIAPGAYVITIKIPGEAPQTETLQIPAGTTWGVLALPTGGYMANQLY